MTIGGMIRCVVTLEVKVAAVVDGEIVVITLVVVKDAGIVMHARKAYRKRITACKFTHLPLHAKNSTSLTANWKLLLNLYNSTLLVLKLTLMLIFL